MARRRGETGSVPPLQARIGLVTDSSRLATTLKDQLGEVRVLRRLADLVFETKSALFIVDTMVPDFAIWPAPLLLNPAAYDKPWIFLVGHSTGGRRLLSLPPDTALFDRSKEKEEQLVSYVQRRLDPQSAKRMERLEYLEGLRTFIVSMENGRTYALKLDDVAEADSSAPVRWRIGRNRNYFAVTQESGNTLEVPWDEVLFHSEPQYEYYKGNREGEVDRASMIGERVRALRNARGLNITQLAERAGMQRPNVSRLEAGRHLPSLETLERIAEAMGVPVAELVTNRVESSGSPVDVHRATVGKESAPQDAHIIRLKVEREPQWKHDPAVLAAESSTGGTVVHATAHWLDHVFRCRVEYEIFNDRLTLIIEESRGFTRPITVLLQSRRSDEQVESPPFLPRSGEQVTVADGKAIFPRDISEMALRLT
jgi:transcriptional regulator with XRE-family HTH domain